MEIKCIRMVSRASMMGMPVTGEAAPGVKYIYTEDICGVSPWRTPPGEVRIDRVLMLDPTQHDFYVANALCTASAWAYSDIDTFSRVMHCRGFVPRHETVGIVNANPAMFVDTTAYVTQSEDRRLAILCFRGTGLQNAVNWLADASVRPDPFMSMGNVHGGFFRSLLVLWPTIGALLRYARQGHSICDAVLSPMSAAQDPAGVSAPHHGDVQRVLQRGDVPACASPLQAGTRSRNELEALYITGHSLGGALALLAAALIQVDPSLRTVREKLRGIYTYGQPMVGDAAFKAYFEPRIGQRIFRHIYERDIVASLPPRTLGRHFTHLGKEYTSSSSGWIYRQKITRQARTAIGSMLIGAFAWIQQQASGVPLLGIVPASVSWGDHSPLNYLRTSQQPVRGSEFL